MTYKELLYITTIYDEGSFSAAAEKLFISQSALSQSVRKVEDEYGIALFSRSGVRAKPTQAGRYFVEQGRSVLQTWEGFNEKLNNYVRHRQLELTVGMPAGLLKNLSPYIVSRFEKAHPHVRLNIVEERSNTLEKLVMQEAINLCVIEEPVYIQSVGRVHAFMSELLLAVPRTHPFCLRHPYRGLGQLETVDLAEFRSEPFSLLKHQRINHMWAPIFADAGFEPIIYRRSSVWNNIKDYVKQGFSVALIEEVYVHHEPDDDKVAYYRVNSDYVFHPVVAAHYPGKRLSEPEKWFINALKEYPCIANTSRRD